MDRGPLRRNYAKATAIRDAVVVLVLVLLGALALITNHPVVQTPLTNVRNVTDFAPDESTKTDVTIKTDSLDAASPISQYDFGVNQVWYENGYGTTDPSTQVSYPKLVSDTKAIGISIVRYPGGNPSDLFHWQNAIGPENERLPNITNGGRVIDPSGLVPSSYGPDEYGAFLHKIGAVGDITVNFGTGTAQEAADWVCYMTSTTNNSSDPACDTWAALRATNGHPAPYSIPYWEVGNEPNLGAYWRSGQVVSSPGNCQTGDEACLYVYGGITRFNDQEVQVLPVQNSANQVTKNDYFVADPPIVSGSAVVAVGTPIEPQNAQRGADPDHGAGSSIWQQVSADQLAKAPLGSHEYALDETSGQMSFHIMSGSSELPAGYQASISYESGFHDGFIGFYNAMKAADPSSHICETYPSDEVLQDLGSTDKYDCYVIHDYGLRRGADNHGLYSASQFHDQVIMSAETLNQGIVNDKTAIDTYAGANAPNVQLVMTEYGILNYDSPDGVDDETSSQPFPGESDYHRSVDLGLFAANMLRNIINSGISMADKHYLVGYNLSPPPGLQGAFNDHIFSGNAIIDTSYPDCGSSGACQQPPFIVQPTAYVIEAYAKLLEKQLISSQVSNDPEVAVNPHLASNPNALKGSYPAISTVATTDGKGSEALLVINNTEHRYITAKIQPSLNNYTHVNAETLAGTGADSYLDFNTLSDPDAVHLVSSSGDLVKGTIAASFPPSSVTVLRFSTCSVSHDAACVIATPTANTSEPDNPINDNH